MSLPEEVVNELTPEMIEQIENTSLEDLLEDLTGIEDTTDKVESGELPEDALAPAMESLRGMLGELRESGAISRVDAQTIQSMTTSMEGFEDTFALMPLSSFTLMPSKVNYDASMENLLSSIGRRIIDAIKKAIEWIRSKVKALMGLFKNKPVETKKVQVAVKKVTTEYKPVANEELIREAQRRLDALRQLENEMKNAPAPRPIKDVPQTQIVQQVIAEVKAHPEVPAAETVKKVLSAREEKIKGALNDLVVKLINGYDQQLLTFADDLLGVITSQAVSSDKAVPLSGPIKYFFEGTVGTKLNISGFDDHRIETVVKHHRMLRTSVNDALAAVKKLASTSDAMDKVDFDTVLKDANDALKKVRFNWIENVQRDSAKAVGLINAEMNRANGELTKLQSAPGSSHDAIESLQAKVQNLQTLLAMAEAADTLAEIVVKTSKRTAAIIHQFGM